MWIKRKNFPDVNLQHVRSVSTGLDDGMPALFFEYNSTEFTTYTFETEEDAAVYHVEVQKLLEMEMIEEIKPIKL